MGFEGAAGKRGRSVGRPPVRRRRRNDPRVTHRRGSRSDRRRERRRRASARDASLIKSSPKLGKGRSRGTLFFFPLVRSPLTRRAAVFASEGRTAVCRDSCASRVARSDPARLGRQAGGGAWGGAWARGVERILDRGRSSAASVGGPSVNVGQTDDGVRALAWRSKRVFSRGLFFSP